MNSSEYLEKAKRTLKNEESVTEIDIFNWEYLVRMMIASLEMGDLVDACKKFLFYKKPIPKEISDDLDLLPAVHGLQGPKKLNPMQMDLLHAALGKYSEAAEFLELVYDHLVQDEVLDKNRILDEVGDGCWYDTIPLRLFDSTYEQVWDGNIAKLQQRFPDKFDASLAIDKDPEAEAIAQEYSFTTIFDPNSNFSLK